MTVTEFLAQDPALLGLFAEGTIRLQVEGNDLPYAEKQITKVELRTDDLSFTEDVTAPMKEAGFTVESVDSDGITLEVVFG